MPGAERDEAETQRQIKGTKTLAIVPLLRVTNRRVKSNTAWLKCICLHPFPPSLPLPAPLYIH